MSGVHGNVIDPVQMIAGEADAHDPAMGPLIVVNPAESPPTGWGAPNVQQYQTGHLNNRPTDESLELGQGVGPERKQGGHYPHATNPNYFRNEGVYLRNGLDGYSEWIYPAEREPWWVEADAQELTAIPLKSRGPQTPLRQQHPTQPYTSLIQHDPYANAGGFYG